MTSKLLVLLSASLIFILPISLAWQVSHAARSPLMVVTIDDLPVASHVRWLKKKQLSQKLINSLTDYQVPAIGFVNEVKLGYGERQIRNQQLLTMWLQAGIELGNHGYQHLSLNRTELTKYQDDVLKGEMVSKALSAKFNLPFRYYRHPFLHTGKTQQEQHAFGQFLAEHHYQIAPVSVRTNDWQYANAYDRAIQFEDSSAQQLIAADYLKYIDATLTHYRQFSLTLFKQEPPQILLLHANQLNADYLSEILQMIRDQGYQFAPLSAALSHPLYQADNLPVNAVGVSWLDRWAQLTNVPVISPPDSSEWLQQLKFK